VGQRWRRGRGETYDGEKSTTNGEKDFAGGVVFVEDDVLWGKGREKMVVGERERREARTGGQVVAAPCPIRVASSRGHGAQNTKHKNNKKQTGFPPPLSGVLLIEIPRSHSIINKY